MDEPKTQTPTPAYDELALKEKYAIAMDLLLLRITEEINSVLHPETTAQNILALTQGLWNLHRGLNEILSYERW